MTAQQEEPAEESNVSPIVLDVTGEVCPMTFVRTRLRLDAMAPGEVLEIRFRGEEPARNLPRSLRDLGQDLLASGEGWLRVRKR